MPSWVNMPSPLLLGTPSFSLPHPTLNWLRDLSICFSHPMDHRLFQTRREEKKDVKHSFYKREREDREWFSHFVYVFIFGVVIMSTWGRAERADVFLVVSIGIVAMMNTLSGAMLINKAHTSLFFALYLSSLFHTHTQLKFRSTHNQCCRLWWMLQSPSLIEAPTSKYLHASHVLFWAIQLRHHTN